MRKVLLASTATIILWSSNCLAFPLGATYFDGLTGLIQYGSTPDTVQDQLDPSLAPSITSTSFQDMSIWMRLAPWDMTNVNLDQRADMVLYESAFASTYDHGVIVQLLNDPDQNNNVSVFYASCNDAYCTDYLYGWAVNVYPLDENWHNLQLFADMSQGTIHLQLDTQDDTPAGFGYVSWSGNPFTTPIAGVYWAAMCDIGGWWGNCFSGDMTELWVYSGPLNPQAVDVASGAFWRLDGSLLRANSLDSSSGTAVFGDYPTIYLRGGATNLPDGNAYNFSFLAPPPILPWVVFGTQDDEGDTGGTLLDSISTPY